MTADQILATLAYLLPILGLEAAVVAAHRFKGSWWPTLIAVQSIFLFYFTGNGVWVGAGVAFVAMIAGIATEEYIDHPWWRKPVLIHQRTDPWHLILSWPSHWPLAVFFTYHVFGFPWVVDLWLEGRFLNIHVYDFRWVALVQWGLAGIAGLVPWILIRPKEWGPSFWDPRTYL